MVKDRTEMLKDKPEISGKQSDLLTNLLLALKSSSDKKNHLDESELYGNLFILIFAGQETTATTLSFALILLAVYQEIQEKLYKEVFRLIGDRIPTYDDYPTLTYCQYIMKETLRMYPPVTILTKTAAKDITLQIPMSKYQNLSNSSSSQQTIKNTTQEETIPLSISKGTIVVLNVGATHYNPLYWPNPEEFIPERFDPINNPFKNKNNEMKEEETVEEDGTPSDSNNNDLPYNRYAFIPFSEGMRACIGRKFSEVEFTFILTLIIQRYSIRVSPKFTKEQALQAQLQLLLRPKYPVELIFTKRGNTKIPDIE